MTHIAGRGRYARETYPEGGRGSGSQPAFAYDQQDTPWSHTQGDVNLIIATATINVQAGSRVRIDGSASFLGQVVDGTGRFLLFAGDAVGATLISLVSESFNNGEFHSLSYLGVLDAQPAGNLTVTLVVNQNSSAGTFVSNAGENVLTLTEIPA